MPVSLGNSLKEIHKHLPEIRLATAGWNGTGLADIPWKDYPIHNIEQWMLPELPKIAKHFAGDEPLTVMFISDPSRLGWFAKSDWCPIPELRGMGEQSQTDQVDLRSHY